MTRFRPCIDIHNGLVKQIIGSTLTDSADSPVENFVAEQTADWFANKYQADELEGGHVIKLGPGNDESARTALASYPNGLQIGGGINSENATDWLEAGASHVIVTSWLFDSQGKFQEQRLEELVRRIGKEKIVLDLSCRRTANGWTVAMNRWQTLTNLHIEAQTLDYLSSACAEFLIHAADVEGKCEGIDEGLVERMSEWGKCPMTYAGGVANMTDVLKVADKSNGKVDVTVGSSLDLFGGSGVRYDDLVQWNQRSES